MATISQITVGETTYDIISKVASGVTAGTYVPYLDNKSGGYYFPSITVDSYGAITEASNTGLKLPVMEESLYGASGLANYAMYKAIQTTIDDRIIHKWTSGAYGTPLILNSSNDWQQQITVTLTAGDTSPSNLYVATNRLISSRTAYKYINIIGVEAFLVIVDSNNYVNVSPAMVQWSAKSKLNNGTQDLQTSWDVTVTANDPPSNGSIYYYILYTVNDRFSVM